MYLSGKVVLITGGAMGIGKYCVEEFLKNDIKGIVIADINGELGEETAEEFNSKYGDNKVTFVETNVSDKNSLEDAFRKTVEKYNNIDVLVNNAGIVDEINWEKELEINLFGTTRGCLLAINTYFPKYRSTSETYIINVASMAGILPTVSFPHYTSSKHGVVGLTRSFGLNRIIAQEGICIMALCPGATDTQILQKPKLVYPELWHHDVEGIEIQRTEAVAESVIEILRKPEHGSVWIINEGVLSKVNYPSLEELIKK